MQAKTASDSLSLNEIIFTHKTNFLLDPRGPVKVDSLSEAGTNLYDKNST